MTTAVKQKRLDKVEAQLTPKEWAIRLADEVRKYPSEADFNRALAKAPSAGDTLILKPYDFLIKQVEERYPGNTPEDCRAKVQLYRKLRTEFSALKRLIITVNEKTKSTAEVGGLKAALKLSTLQTVILQDAFGRTARKATLWVEEYKPADKDEDEERQIMLKELAAYMDVDFGERFTDSLPLGEGMRLRLPSIIENWVKDTVALMVDVFTHEAAVRAIQEKHFDGRPILFLDVEARLAETIKTMENGATTFNEYLKTRETLFKAEWDQEDQEDGIASAIPGEREGLLTIDIDAVKGRVGRRLAAALADQWMKDAKEHAIADALEDTGEKEAYVWQHFRGQVGVKP